MNDFLFDLPDNEEGIQPTVLNLSPDQLFERSFEISAKDAVEEALWSCKYQGTLSGRLTIAREMERNLLRRLREDEIFAADLTRGHDKKGNLRTLLGRWIKEAA